MNSTGTHFSCTPEGEKQLMWQFTATTGQCIPCATKEDVLIITFGSKQNFGNWSRLCRTHLHTQACKKQVCPACNKKALVKPNPSICTKCMELLMENYQSMMSVCKFPDSTINECGCEYCKKRNRVFGVTEF